jgi:hypothetical protein
MDQRRRTEPGKYKLNRTSVEHFARVLCHSDRPVEHTQSVVSVRMLSTTPGMKLRHTTESSVHRQKSDDVLRKNFVMQPDG